jgi:LPXTG-motif cell wall-anchored protein
LAAGLDSDENPATWTVYADLEDPVNPVDPPVDPVDPPVDPVDPDPDPVDPVKPVKPNPDPIEPEEPVAEATPLDLPEDDGKGESDELELPETGDSTAAFIPLVTAGFALTAAGSALTLRRKKLN